MRIYKIATNRTFTAEKGPFSVNRDDNEMRLVVCPKCRSWNVSKIIEHTDGDPELGSSWRPIAWGCSSDHSGEGMVAMRCNSKKCGACFAFYPEDGTRRITESEAKQAEKDERFDMKDDGWDNHGHAPYILFVEDPTKMKRNASCGRMRKTAARNPDDVLAGSTIEMKHKQGEPK